MSITAFERALSSAARTSAPAIVQLWLLRLALHTDLIHELGDDWPDPRICAVLKLPEQEAKSGPKLAAHLQAELSSLEQTAVFDDTISRNLGYLGERMKLEPAERLVLALAAHAEAERALLHALRVFEDDDAALCDAIAVATGAVPDEVRLALRPEGTLRGARMIRRDPLNRFSLRFLSLQPTVAMALRQPVRDADELVAKFFGPTAASTTLVAGDFPHLAADILIATRLLLSALETGAAGVNILLHGPPGTGKTELSRVLAKRANATLYEVAVTDNDGDPSEGSSRLTAYAFCQRALRAAPTAVVLFDEIEDALPRKSLGWLGVTSETQAGKGWLCRTLEENTVPSIWISNAIDHIDPAYLRRFTFVIEVPAPPTVVRRRMLDHALRDVGVSDVWLGQVAARPEVTPAQVEQARKVALFLRSGPGNELEGALDRVLDGTIEALGGARRSGGNVHLELGGFDLSYVNSSLPLTDVINGVANSRRCRALLYGPPGTGKTAFVAHLGATLGLPILAKRVSDLQSAWLGQTEKNLAAAFREAQREGAILFLDEADGFLQNRAQAVRSWEVTQVNELLVQMEAFDGIFVCATNLLDLLDPAAMRRFDFKICFQALSPEQRARLFVATLRMFGQGGEMDSVSSARPTWQARLSRLDGLAAGDYASAARRLKMLAVSVDASRLLAELEVEHGLKARPSVLGFRR